MKYVAIIPLYRPLEIGRIDCSMREPEDISYKFHVIIEELDEQQQMN